ncbi:hypothetical protein K438DRAFT_1999305 [Mycena galopus ATCC 62051]|nr:hypothetical protein K438DRAFT_1999305 [Mycena galopus ATCC 62051]
MANMEGEEEARDIWGLFVNSGSATLPPSNSHFRQEFYGDFAKVVSGMQGRKVPVMAINKFCRQYNLSKKIHQLLDNEGFETAGELFQVADGELKELGFKPGCIAELKRALMEFSAQAQ